jgi:hypothetical protein
MELVLPVISALLDKIELTFVVIFETLLDILLLLVPMALVLVVITEVLFDISVTLLAIEVF